MNENYSHSLAYEVEVHWETATGKAPRGTPLGLRVSNIKLMAGFFVHAAWSNFKDGEINGFKFVSNTGTSEFCSIIEKSKPSDFSFKTAVSLNRYTQIQHQFILESQITDSASEILSPEGVVSVLQANILTLFNMVPGYVDISNS